MPRLNGIGSGRLNEQQCDPDAARERGLLSDAGLRDVVHYQTFRRGTTDELNVTVALAPLSPAIVHLAGRLHRQQDRRPLELDIVGVGRVP